MSLKLKIQEDFIKALRNQEAQTLSTLRLLKTAILNKEKEKRYKLSKTETGANLEKKSELVDEEIVDLIFSEIKKRKEAIVLYEQGKRPELAAKEKAEIEILRKYLPAQISEAEIENLAKEAIKNTGAKAISDMSKVMKELMPKLKGQAEPQIISGIIKKLLEK